MKRLILASGSPRRKDLLEQMGYSFLLHKSNIEEYIEEGLKPQEVVMSLAAQKAEDISDMYPNDIVLGSDTIVTYEQKLLGKPKNEDEARDMLQMLSGKKHHVLTGVALVEKGQTYTFYEKTEVTFWELSKEEIEQYIKSGEPFDKAGAYGIQGLGASLVKGIHGDYFSVVGLPLSRVVRELRQIGIEPNKEGGL